MARHDRSYVSELGLMFYSPLKLVWMDTCFDGRIGSLYGDLSDIYNPYAVNIYAFNDLAAEFGIYDNSWTIGASYCGFFEMNMGDERYADFAGKIFGCLGQGLSLDQSIMEAFNDGRFTGSYPGGIDMQYGPWNSPPESADNPCYNWRVPMPPYHNLRVHGNPWMTYLDP